MKVSLDLAGEGARLERRDADRAEARLVEDDREAVHLAPEQRLHRLGRHVARREAGAAGGEDDVDRRDRRPRPRPGRGSPRPRRRRSPGRRARGRPPSSRSASRPPGRVGLLGRACRRRSAPRSAADGRSGSRLFRASLAPPRAVGTVVLASARSSASPPARPRASRTPRRSSAGPSDSRPPRTRRGDARRRRRRRRSSRPGATAPQRWTIRTALIVEALAAPPRAISSSERLGQPRMVIEEQPLDRLAVRRRAARARPTKLTTAPSPARPAMNSASSSLGRERAIGEASRTPSQPPDSGGRKATSWCGRTRALFGDDRLVDAGAHAPGRHRPPPSRISASQLGDRAAAGCGSVQLDLAAEALGEPAEKEYLHRASLLP